MTVTFAVAPVVPRAWLPKLIVEGVRLTATTPVPVSAAICGSLVALSTIVSEPERVPGRDGVNVTVIKQLAPARSVAGLIGHALVSAKSDKLDVMLVIVSGVVNPFFRVTCFDAEVVLST